MSRSITKHLEKRIAVVLSCCDCGDHRNAVRVCYADGMTRLLPLLASYHLALVISCGKNLHQIFNGMIVV